MSEAGPTRWSLRPGVRVEAVGPDTAALVDPLLGRRVKLDALGTRLALALGPAPGRPVGEVAAELGAEPVALASALASLERLHMIDTPTARALADDAEATRAVQAAAPEVVPLLVRPDARFTCTMCGSCCGGHNVGPVTEEILAGLAPHRERLEAASGSAKGLFLEVGSQVVCHSIGGSCVFLTEDRLCRIHAELGGDKKPRPCRIFPFELVATPRGVAVTIQRECRGFPEARNGKLLSESLDAIRDVLAIAGKLPLVRPVVRHADGTVLDWDAYEALESRLHGIVDDPTLDAAGVLVALGRAVARREPDGLAPGDPDEVGAVRAELQAVTAAIGDAMTAMLATVPAPTESLRVQADGLAHVRLAAQALVPDLARALADPERPDQRSLFRDHLHHALMAKDLLLADTLEAGVARLVLEWLLARAFAIARAREVKRRHLVVQDLMDGLVAVSFLFHHEHFRRSLLAGLDARTSALFVRDLPFIVANARAIQPPETRAELVKF